MENGYCMSWDKNNKRKIIQPENIFTSKVCNFMPIFFYIMVKLITAKYNERKMIMFE